jgi:hypothetical protein
MVVRAPVTLPYREWTTPVVEASYEGPGPQRRLTIAFRIILAIPHLVYVFLVTIAALVATIAAWFAALALGRLPDGLADFLARAVQYVARVNAYAYLLLTDRNPPFDLGHDDYAVSVDIPRRVRLNRGAVLFRIVLLIPTMIVVQFIGNGLFVVVLVAWLLALMMGRLPVPLFEAFAAVLRYQARFYAYAAMLTSEYEPSKEQLLEQGRADAYHQDDDGELESGFGRPLEHHPFRLANASCWYRQRNRHHRGDRQDPGDHGAREPEAEVVAAEAHVEVAPEGTRSAPTTHVHARGRQSQPQTERSNQQLGGTAGVTTRAGQRSESCQREAHAAAEADDGNPEPRRRRRVGGFLMQRRRIPTDLPVRRIRRPPLTVPPPRGEPSEWILVPAGK